MNLLQVLQVLTVPALVLGINVQSGSLRVDGTIKSLAVDSTNPRLSWRLESQSRGDSQIAFQVQAAGTDSLWTLPNLWDSGRIPSSDPFVRYNGRGLKSRSAVFWRVRVWDVNNKPSQWSQASTFEVALLQPSDWKASWITNPDFATGKNSLPLFAKDFNVGCVVSKARLYLLGLGVHAPEINGQAVDDTVLAPGYSTFNRTLWYSTYDVARLLKPGNNVIGVQIGKGIYDSDKPLGGKRYTKFAIPSQPLKLIAQLEYMCLLGTSHTIISDDSWASSTDGPYLEAHWYGGEEYNALKEIKDWSNPGKSRQNWTTAKLTTSPGGALTAPRAPQIKRCETITAVSVKPGPDYLLFDFGVNNAGTFNFKINGTGLAGRRVTFWPAERLKSNGYIDQSTMGTNIFHAYTIKGAESEVYSPKFIYHGMQYLGINLTLGSDIIWAPKASDMSMTVIRASNEQVLEASTSDKLFNGIHSNIDRSIKSNMHSVLTDCPHREKLGWLEQDHLVFDPVAMGYDIEAYGLDFMRTIADAQAPDIPGLIPTTAPEYVVFSGQYLMYRDDPNWGVAAIRFPLLHYEYYGDITILTMRYNVMSQYMDYLQQQAGGKPYMPDSGLGDWLTLNNTTPKGATATFAYHQAASGMAAVEKYLNHTAKAAEYQALAGSIREGYHSRYFNETGSPHYCVNTQACNAMALDIGAVPVESEEAVLFALIDSLEEQGWHWDVGEISLPSLIRVLKGANRNDILYELFSQTTVPSYGSQVVYGSTSLWEHWDAPTTGGSYNHFMFGYGDIWIVELSGLSQSSGSVAWKQIDYKPVVVGDLTQAKTSYRTPRGRASAEWSRTGSSLEYNVEVPVGSIGTVTLNSTLVTLDGGKIKAGMNGVTSTKENEGQTVIKVGSGMYKFHANLA
ncbi:hypothetical protein SLS60_002698 [Paraconiothyrium brasiliense]|uniref:alpha-L-rhamnosidase n=1 Tax=Paraconiothyrium brasiliense TaxID=300254 RepID=A0ABR3RTU2_9PLEO